MSNQRKAERVKAMTFTTVYNQQGHVLLGFLGDLTLKGAMVMGEKPLEVHQDLTLRIEFNNTAEVPEGHLTIPAHTAWCRREEETAYYHTGFEFIALTDSNKRLIETLIKKYEFSRET